MTREELYRRVNNLALKAMAELAEEELGDYAAALESLTDSARWTQEARAQLFRLVVNLGATKGINLPKVAYLVEDAGSALATERAFDILEESAGDD